MTFRPPVITRIDAPARARSLDDPGRNGLIPNLIARDALPFNQEDWPVPKGYTPAIGLRIWTQNLLETTLNGQDQFFGLAGHPNYDWPNPIGYTPAITLRSYDQSLVNTTLVPIAAMPFNQFDWPLPGTYPYPITIRGPAQGLNPNIFPPSPAPPNLKRLFIDLDTGNLIWRLTN